MLRLTVDDPRPLLPDNPTLPVPIVSVQRVTIEFDVATQHALDIATSTMKHVQDSLLRPMDMEPF